MAPLGSKRFHTRLFVTITALLALVVMGMSPAFAGGGGGGGGGGGSGGKKSPTVQFKSGSYSASENVGIAYVAVTLNPRGDATVTLTAVGGSATGGADCSSPATDFVTQPGTTVTFSNQRQVNVPVTICNNNGVWEGSETIALGLTGPSAGTSLGGQSTATLVINDDDPVPTLSISDPTGAATEGTSLDFKVTLSAPATYPISVDYATSDGTAEDETGDGDYTSESGTLLWAPGDNSDRTINIGVSDNYGFDLPDETFAVDLSNAQGAGLVDWTATGHITNNDEYLSITDGSGSEAGQGPINFDINVTGTPGPVSVDLTSTDGTATSGSSCDPGVDYGPVTNYPAFPAAWAYYVCDDTEVEPNETFDLSLSNPSGADIDPTASVGTMTIKDDEPFSTTVTLAEHGDVPFGTDQHATVIVYNTSGDPMPNVDLWTELWRDTDGNLLVDQVAAGPANTGSGAEFDGGNYTSYTAGQDWYVACVPGLGGATATSCGEVVSDGNGDVATNEDTSLADMTAFPTYAYDSNNWVSP